MPDSTEKKVALKDGVRLDKPIEGQGKDKTARLEDCSEKSRCSLCPLWESCMGAIRVV